MNYGALVEDLWNEWEGPGPSDGFIWLYAVGHVDVFHPPVYRNLARVLQHSGVAESARSAFSTVDHRSVVLEVYAGPVDSGPLEKCDEYGYTDKGDLVDEVIEVTIVEVPTNE